MRNSFNKLKMSVSCGIDYRRFIRSKFLLCFYLLLLFECTQYKEDYSTQLDDMHANSSKLLLDSSTGVIIKMQDDPFSLNALNHAKNELINGEGSQIFTKVKLNEISSYDLKPTHFALTVFPRSYKEISQIERNEGVNVAYYPFNYSIVGNVKEGIRGEFDAYVAEKNPHVMKYENVLSTENDSIIPVMYDELPVLYVVWPIELEIPDTLDYRIDYEVCLPGSAQDNEDNYRIIKKEAIRKTLGIAYKTKAMEDPGDSAGYKGLAGYIKCWDTHTNSYQGIGGLSVRAQFGSYIQYSETTSDGHFYLLAEIPDHSSFYCDYSKIWHWVIRLNNASSSYYYSFGSVNSVLGNGVQYNYNLNLYPSAPHIINCVQRAVSYYYKSLAHDVTPAKFSSELFIRAFNSYTLGNNYGETYIPSNGDPYIYLYDYSNNSADIIGTTFHELGHVTMFKDKGSYTNFTSMIKFLHESFACYMGWYLSSCFYVSLGETVNDSFNYINQQKHQNWVATQTTYGRYSPLFIDLCDSYNQSISSVAYLNDDLSGMTYPIIRQLAVSSTTWDSCKSLLTASAGTYYTPAQLSQYTAGIDGWFVNNPSELTEY
ncbi:MAG: hypothetical protein IJ222_01845 [Bacteroidales bacterium]|nr:hypothetical protein [Bacteroidales bacterium]